MKTCFLPSRITPGLSGARVFAGVLRCLTLLLSLQLPAPAASQTVTAVTSVSITVEDLESQLAFFTGVLEFKQTGSERWEGPEVAALFGLPVRQAAVQVVTLQLGTEQIRLFDFEGEPSRPVPADTRSNDLWFQHLAIVVRDMDLAYQRLLERQVTHVSTAPQTLPDYLPNAAGIQAFYFRDPEGHNLELIWFPPGKGQPRWQNPPADALFLGIDHTAIGISSTTRGMAFYRDGLGLTQAGHSENYGPEQEHLNQVFGARLDINGLHAPKGPGVEFLRYIAPPGGRPYPAGSTPTDLLHYQTDMTTEQLDVLLPRLKKAGYTPVSDSPVTLNGRRMALLRDPDGHAVLLQQGG